MILKYESAKSKLKNIETVIETIKMDLDIKNLLNNNQISADIYKIEYTDEVAKIEAENIRDVYRENCDNKMDSFLNEYYLSIDKTLQTHHFMTLKNLYIEKGDDITNDEISSLLSGLDDIESKKEDIIETLTDYIQEERNYYDAITKVESCTGYLMGLYKNNGEEAVINVDGSALSTMRNQYSDGYNDGGESVYERTVNKNLVGMGYISKTVFEATEGVMNTIFTTITASVISDKVKLPNALINASKAIGKVKNYAITEGVNRIDAIQSQAEIFNSEMQNFLNANNIIDGNLNVDGLSDDDNITISRLVDIGRIVSILGPATFATSCAVFGLNLAAGMINDIESEKNGVAAYEYFCRTGKSNGTTYLVINEPDKEINYDMSKYGFHTLKADGTRNIINGTSEKDHIESLNDSEDKFSGNGGNDTLIGAKMNDVLNGGLGGDTYIYSSGDGVDTIEGEYFFSSGDNANDVLHLTNLVQDDVELYKEGTNLIINVRNDEQGKIIIENYYELNGERSDRSVDYIQFKNSKIELSDLLYNRGDAELNNPELIESNDVLGANNIKNIMYGNQGRDDLSGGGGNDTLYGDDYQNTKSGEDNLYGGMGNDTLIGGQGNDTLEGGVSNDTYIFRAGDGQDTINEESGSDDKIIFENVSSSRVRLDQTVSRGTEQKLI